MPKDIKKETLDKIKSDNIKVRSKNYFWFWKIILYSLTAILAMIAIYIFNLLFYLPHRTPRIPGHYFSNLTSLFPWPLLIVGSLVVGLLIFLYRSYEGGYKKHLVISAIIVFVIILFVGALVAGSRLNERLERRPGLQRFYQWNEDNFVPRGPRDGSGPGRMMRPE